jgi:hypothetical protein
LIVVTESDGVATKKWERGTAWPGVAPDAHVVPDESVAGAGTKTCHRPESST